MTSSQTTSPTILRRDQVEGRTGLSRSAIYQLQAAGTFPKSIRLTSKSVGWLESEISEWVLRQVEKSRNAPGAQR